MDNKTKWVFISYVRENLDQIDKICTAFETNSIEYWMDRDRIDPGKIWKDAIKQAIHEGANFLTCFSKEFESRFRTHMNEELYQAVEILREKPFNSGWFIPVILSDCEIPPIPIGASLTLRDIQYVSFCEGWEHGIRRLIDTIKSALRLCSNRPQFTKIVCQTMRILSDTTSKDAFNSYWQIRIRCLLQANRGFGCK